jgi:hypothetical protein
MSEKNKQFKEVIKAYLDKRAQEDELFAKAYAKPQKCIEACCKYIISMARKLGNAVAVPDDVVYGWAVHYYDEEGIKIEEAPECEVQPVVAQAAKITAEATARMEKEKAEKKVKKTKAVKAEPVSPFVQLSLFG